MANFRISLQDYYLLQRALKNLDQAADKGVTTQSVGTTQGQLAPVISLAHVRIRKALKREVIDVPKALR